MWWLELTLRVTQQQMQGPNRCPQGVPKMSQIKCGKWECFTQCKHLTILDIDAIVSFKASFGLPVEKVRQALAECDMVPPSLN